MNNLSLKHCIIDENTIDRKKLIDYFKTCVELGKQDIEEVRLLVDKNPELVDHLKKMIWQHNECLNMLFMIDTGDDNIKHLKSLISLTV